MTLTRVFESAWFHGLALSGLIFGVGCVDDVDSGTATSSEVRSHDNDSYDFGEFLQIIRGSYLFNRETFNGNGRTCSSCHPSRRLLGQNGTLSPADVQALWQENPNDPLFQHDAADELGGDTFDRFRAHATILIDMPLPPNVRIVGSDARSVLLPRGIPSTMNTPALDPVLMLDGREPTLQSQALHASLGHAQSDPISDDDLDAIAAFEKVLFNRPNLRAAGRWGVPITIPYATTEAEQRGRRFFIDDNTDDPNLVGESPQNICGWCHGGPFLNEMSGFFAANVFPFPNGHKGDRFTTALVSEINPLGNPVYDFEFTLPDGSTTVVSSPDPGLALLTGDPATAGVFKNPTVWGAKDTAPYFHDNSANNLQELMDHYDLALFLLSSENPNVPEPIDLTEQNKADIIAYMQLL